jgi:hypothetical protein
MRLFEGQNIVLLTKHGKERVIRSVLEEKLGCRIHIENRFDTDKFGTFSREVKRPKSQLDTARLKIKKGMKLSGLNLGLASEGSFGSHPIAPIMWNIEVVLLYDSQEKKEVYGVHESSDTNCAHQLTNNYEEVLEFAKKNGFPEHYLILRPDSEKSKHIFKDVNSFSKLEDIYNQCVKKSKNGYVFIETDMRAHANPTRMKNIEKATQNLLEKLLCNCPSCGMYGFEIKETVRGLPCESCGFPSEMTHHFVYQCSKCKFKKIEKYPRGKFAPAQYCYNCNP